MHVRNHVEKQAVNLNDGVSWDKYERARYQTVEFITHECSTIQNSVIQSIMLYLLINT